MLLCLHAVLAFGCMKQPVLYPAHLSSPNLLERSFVTGTGTLGVIGITQKFRNSRWDRLEPVIGGWLLAAICYPWNFTPGDPALLPQAEAGLRGWLLAAVPGASPQPFCPTTH